MNKPMEPYRIQRTYLYLGPNGTASPLTVTNTFWQELGEGKYSSLGEGRLVSHFHCTENWGVWERHPHGEEIVLLVSGALELVLNQNNIETRVALTEPGSFAIVPRGAWHTANVREPSSMLFITSGEGTENKAR